MKLKLKKKCFCSLWQCSSKNWYKKPGKLTNYNSSENIFMTQSILLKWNKNFFLLENYKTYLPFDPFSPLHWWFPLESSSIVCMIAFSFPRIIYFNFLQMKADAFSQRQHFPYFRNSLLKLGQSWERHLDFHKRKADQVNLIVNSLSFSA